MNSIAPMRVSADDLGQREQLFGRSVVARHAAPVVGNVQLELAAREPGRAVTERGAQEFLHLPDLCGGRGALRRVVAHDRASDRAVPDVGRDVHTDASVEIAEEFAERAAGPIDRGLQRVRAHPFDAAEHQQEPRDVVRFGGAQGEPAVAGEDRGHAVPRSGRRGRVPVQLRVVVGVDVDEARRDGQTVGVDDLARLDRVAERADLGDAAVVHCDIRGACRPARPVHDGAAPDEEIDRHQRVMPYRSRALVPKSPARASRSIPSVHSRNSSTTPGYLASLCGKSLAHTARSAP